jgi:hypothetical protein
MAQPLSTNDLADRATAPEPIAGAPAGIQRLILIRTAASAGADERILDLCRSQGLPARATNLGGRGDDALVVAVEVPASRVAGSAMLEAQLRALPGVASVSVTPVGVATRVNHAPNRS